jgi:peptide/nickel transport system permease protein
LTSAALLSVAPSDSRWRTTARLLLDSWEGRVGCFLFLFFVVVAVAGPLVLGGDPMRVHYLPGGKVARLLTPLEFGPFGTDYYGRDVFAQLVLGARTALIVSLLSTLIMALVGTNIGLVAGYFGGRVDALLMRFTDLAYSVPFLPFAVILVALLKPSLWNIVLTISVLMWRTTARVIRSQVLTVRQQTFVKAARVAGASHARIIYLHIFPNVLPLALLYLAFGISYAVLSEASLSFLGFGDPERMSWGQMLYFAYTSASIRTAWWWTIPPGACITLFVLSVFLIGRQFERYVSPKLA